MVAHKRLLLSIFLASMATTATGASWSSLDHEDRQDVKPTGTSLRGGSGGGFGNVGGKKTVTPPPDFDSVPKETTENKPRILSVDREEYEQNDGVVDDIQYIMISCKKGENESSCRERIMTFIPEDAKSRFKLTTYLKLVNAYAAEMKGDGSFLDGLEGVEDDPVRELEPIEEEFIMTRSGDVPHIPYGIDMIKAREVWELHNTKGENVRVCVVDTGITLDHTDLQWDKMFGYDGDDMFNPWWIDPNGHGTHVAGTIAASDNGHGVVGVAPNVEIFTVRLLDDYGYLHHSSGMINALDACMEGGSKVINLSLGGFIPNQLEKDAFEELYKKGIVVVAASGNSHETDFSFPASYDNVISVASVDSNGLKSDFSTYNDQVDVAAPGRAVWSTYSDGGYSALSGTSMACPHVTGLVALMLSVAPRATPAQIYSALTSTAQNPYTTAANEREDYLGYGIVDGLAAVDYIIKTDKDTPNCIDFSIKLHTDNSPHETTHWLEEHESGEWIFYENDFKPYQTLYWEDCVDPTLCYDYYLYDSFGDGISGEGVEVKYNGEVLLSGGSFHYGGVLHVGDCLNVF